VRQVETGRWRQVPPLSGAPESSHGFSTLILPGCGKEVAAMIRKLKSGEYRLYSRKKDPDTGKRRNLGTFKTREAAEKHEREVQYFKRH
jgi:hypothetical protein